MREIDINVLIAVRGGSQRVPKKNIRPFAGSSLLEIKVKQALRIKDVSKVILSSEDDEMLNLAEDFGATALKRDPYYTSDTVPMGDVYKHLSTTLDCKDILWAPVTSPLITDKSMQDCIDFYKTNTEYDSVVTTNIIKEYMWLDGKAINYDPKHHPRSQDLPDIYALNFAAHILPREIMFKNANILGDKFYPYMLNEIEAVDVDTAYEFMLAEMFYNQREES